MSKSCEDCTNYLLCKKVKAEDENHETCEKFEDNFPEDEEVDTNVPEDDEDDDEKESVPYVCIGAGKHCGGCPHATPHDPYDEYLDGTCVDADECDTIGQTVKCIPM